jgi:adenylate kinase family enzyme
MAMEKRYIPVSSAAQEKQMKKAIIVGSAGAGKSTFAKRLGKITGLEVIHLDALFWHEGWVPTEREEWIRVQEGLLQKEQWILDGNYGGTIEMRIEASDSIFFLHYSTVRCLYGALKRRVMNHGRTRPDMAEGCPEQLDWQFLKWIARYKKDKAPAILAKLSAAKEKDVYIFHNPEEAEEYLRSLTRP